MKNNIKIIRTEKPIVRWTILIVLNDIDVCFPIINIIGEIIEIHIITDKEFMIIIRKKFDSFFAI